MPGLFASLADSLRHPFAAGGAGGLVTAMIFLAVFGWPDGDAERWKTGYADLDAAIAMARQGATSDIPGPFGSTITMGFGQTPGRSDPDDQALLWQQVKGLNPTECAAVAHLYHSQPFTVSVRIGTKQIRSDEAIVKACRADSTITALLALGKSL